MTLWIEITIKTPLEAVEAVSNRLLELGSSGVVTDDTILKKEEEDFYYLKGCFPDNDKFSSIFFKISSYLDSLKSMGFEIGPDELTITKIKDEYLSGNWKRYFKTIEIGKNLVIKPPWEVYENRKGKVCIEINPALSFGTGGHATTKLCLLLLEEVCGIGNVSSMLDAGCGSGILAIAGKKLNIEKVVGLDIDPVAINESRKNAELNDLKDEIEFFEGKLDDVNEGCFALIAANIYSGPLCRMMPLFKKKLARKGNLIVSGIMNDQEDIVLDFAKRNGFKLKKTIREENWSALVFSSIPQQFKAFQTGIDRMNRKTIIISQWPINNNQS